VGAYDCCRCFSTYDQWPITHCLKKQLASTTLLCREPMSSSAPPPPGSQFLASGEAWPTRQDDIPRPAAAVADASIGGLNYCFDAPRAPARQEWHTPKPLPLPRMEEQRPVMLANSPALSVEGTNLCSTAL
jgi:hypothetical protein